jgi:hypothetical protein
MQIKNCPALASRTVPLIVSKEDFARLEATPGIEPGFTDLQSAASPLRHVAFSVPLERRWHCHLPYSLPAWQLRRWPVSFATLG